MGDPKRQKMLYEPPLKLWDAERIKDERALVREYGLKNMRELWVIIYKLKKVRRTARKLIAQGDRKQKEASQLMGRLIRLGIAKEGSALPDLLTLTVRDFLERRLQTQVSKQGLARTLQQARQLITHGFIAVGGKRVSSPSYIVTVDTASKITYFKKIDLDVSSEIAEKPEGQAKPESGEASAPSA
ncbi:30S ribosomal protein S4 [Candidatus Micrarchaeota archaeon CG11_big_fil_rev_8_21_14_0_20_47_5]|nr:MAG: 30S ribosomal protein S4 [Candidatus Micrarchaeota archaeon CG1_02_47_40]PIN84458.1 MAG: 30S ribosomal protein S4 [Candidatus Micrarchaeota archaeon CG11_big_fil_rev_8_21_14_0_20_47_5]